MRKKLPIGIQSFTQIRREGYYYVDKTPFLARMVESGGKYYFLSRPRRFGKSLLLDTIACAFSGQRELFAAHDGGMAARRAKRSTSQTIGTGTNATRWSGSRSSRGL